MIAIDDRVGFHPALAGLAAHSPAVLEGVGTPDPDFSHFEMFRRWWEGDPTGSAGLATGFLGRCCDQLAGDEPVTGVSLGWGSTPALVSASAVTTALPEPDAAWFLDPQVENPGYLVIQDGLRALANGNLEGPTGSARKGIANAMAFVDLLNGLPEASDDYPGSDVGHQLSLASRLIRADAGIRVIHVPFGDFDTHNDQRGTHDYLMMEMGEATSHFLNDLARNDRGGEVLVATVSDFGRRPEQNGSGTDHGAASIAMLLGPIDGGLYGEPLALNALDETDNLTASVNLDEYYATLAEGWFGISATEVLEGSPTMITGLV